MVLSNKVVFLDDYTYRYANKIYHMFKHKLYKVYPPCGFIAKTKESDSIFLEKLRELDEYVLGVTVLSKSGPYLKLEALPHAHVFYQIAKKNPDIAVVVVGVVGGFKMCRAVVASDVIYPFVNLFVFLSVCLSVCVFFYHYG